MTNVEQQETNQQALTIQQRAAEALDRTLELEHRNYQNSRRNALETLKKKFVGVLKQNFDITDVDVFAHEGQHSGLDHVYCEVDGLQIQAWEKNYYHISIRAGVPCPRCHNADVFVEVDNLVRLGELLRDGAPERYFCETCWTAEEEGKDVVPIAPSVDLNRPLTREEALQQEIMERFNSLHQLWHLE